MLQNQSKVSIIILSGDVYISWIDSFFILNPVVKNSVFFFPGAQKEGATGFFKGVGKGLVGAVTRPTEAS